MSWKLCTENCIGLNIIYNSCQSRRTELIIWREDLVSLWRLVQECWHVIFMGSSIYFTAVLFVFTAITGSLIQQSNYYSRYSCTIIANRVNINPIDTIIFSILILFSFRWIFNPISFLFFLISYENLWFLSSDWKPVKFTMPFCFSVCLIIRSSWWCLKQISRSI
jgi:hypothetical protein